MTEERGAPGGSRTRTRQCLRLLPLPIGPRGRVVHPAGVEPAHALGLSQLPLPVGLRMRWSGRRAMLPPPPAWDAGALLNELLPGLAALTGLEPVLSTVTTLRGLRSPRAPLVSSPGSAPGTFAFGGRCSVWLS